VQHFEASDDLLEEDSLSALYSNVARLANTYPLVQAFVAAVFMLRLVDVGAQPFVDCCSSIKIRAREESTPLSPYAT
jgi:hypothetical protein